MNKELDVLPDEVKQFLDEKLNTAMRKDYDFNKLIEYNKDAFGEFTLGSAMFWYKSMSDAEKALLNTLIGVAYVNGHVNLAEVIPDILNGLAQFAIKYGEEKEVLDNLFGKKEHIN